MSYCNLPRIVFVMLARQSRILLPILLTILVTSCSSDARDTSSSTEESKSAESAIQQLTKEEIADLKSALKSLNVNFDEFDSSYLVNSRPIEDCPNHTIWIDIKLSADRTNIEPYLHLFTRDDVLDKIGRPSGVLIKHASETIEYSNPNGEFLDNISCAGSAWGYQSQHYLNTDIDTLDYMLSVFQDPTSKFRLLPDEIQSGYRDAKLSQGQREKNVTALRLVKAAVLGQITPSEILGN